MDKLNSVQDVLQSQKLQLAKILERVTDVRLDNSQDVLVSMFSLPFALQYNLADICKKQN